MVNTQNSGNRKAAKMRCYAKKIPCEP